MPKLKSFRRRALAVAGGLLLAALASAASGVQGKPHSKPPVPELKQEKRVRGRWDMADGQIKSVTCKGRALDMAFDDSDEILQLHTDNYFKLKFSAINFTPKGILNPCKTAQGMYARVYYYHIKDRPRQGDLISVEFRK